MRSRHTPSRRALPAAALVACASLAGCAGGEGSPSANLGGGLSCVHPGMYGLFTVVEAVEQLQGTAGDRQVPDAKLALAHGNGGVLSSQVTAILGTRETL